MSEEEKEKENKKYSCPICGSGVNFVMDGELDDITDALIKADEEETLND